ncbi:hypothetical protein HYS47_02610 [Candidatus Woesearchaeota archaeon]|nr:hypothetical protein [Candidatus Woesearchaeota archaeon]
MSDLLVVRAKLKDVAGGLNVSGDLAEALDKKVRQLLSDGIERAKANKRNTLMAKDI